MKLLFVLLLLTGCGNNSGTSVTNITPAASPNPFPEYTDACTQLCQRLYTSPDNIDVDEISAKHVCCTCTKEHGND